MYSNNLKITTFCMLISGVHPDKIGGMLQDVLFFSALLANLVQVYLIVLLFVYEENLSLEAAVGSIESLCILAHGLLKLNTEYAQRPRFVALIRRLKDFRKIEDVEDEATKAACLRTTTFLKIVTGVFLFGSLCSMLTFTIGPMLKHKLIFMTYYPRNMPYSLLISLQYHAYMTAIFFPCVSFDCMYVTMAFLIKLQFQIVNYNISKTFPKEVREEEEEVIRGRIKEWVDYHNFLLDFVKLSNKTFSKAIFLYFGIVISSMCMELFILSTQTTSEGSFKYYSYIGSVFFEFIGTYCMPGQLVTNEADKITGNIWESGWYEKPSSSVKAAVNMILIRSQQTVFITAGIFNATLQTCLATLKTIVSYYMFLRTVVNKAE